MNFKQFIQDYFTFSRNERKGITVLLILIFLLAIANKVVFYFETPARIDEALLDKFSRELGTMNDSVIQMESSKKLFFFNPNTIESLSLDSLNLPESVKSNLLKFRSKGGKFYSASDFRKIYGVTDEIFNQVSPYLMFENETNIESSNKNQNKLKPELFLFDPNQTSDNDFLRLGLSEKQIASVRLYLKNGGEFHNKEDFMKFRAISEKQKLILSDYLLIKDFVDSPPKEQKISAEIQININTADSILLKQLPGIGGILSKRIVKYRDLLGGFYAVNQLKEVYGLNEQTFQQIESKISIDEKKIRRLNLNFADESELSKHPYLQKGLARKIIKFRTKYGSIRDISILRDSMILNIDEYNRIKPYL